MSSVAAIADLLKVRFKSQQARTGQKPERVLETFAERVKASPGTLASILRKRVNKVCSELRERIIKAAMADIQQEISTLEHEQELYRNLGFNPSHHDFLEVEEALAKARAGLARMKGAAR